MKILAAEDDPMSRRLLEATLVRWGYEVVTAADGAEAWNHLQQDDAPQLAILDWMMPLMDGVDVCRHVRNLPEARLVYIILLTTKDLREDIVAGLEAGANDYVKKPFNRDELRARVRVGVRMVELQTRLAEQARELEAEQQRTRSFHELMMARARFDAAVEAMSDGILVADGDHHITTANRAACRLLNIPPDEWQGLPLDSVLEPFSLSIPLDELMHPKERTVALEITRPDTRPPLYLDARSTRVLGPSGELESVVLTVRDVTAQRHVQNVRSDFFTMVSHKLRTPLSILSGYLSLCAQMPPDKIDQMNHILAVCDKQTQLLADLVERLLEFKSLSMQELEAEAQRTAVEPAINSSFEEIRKRYPQRQLELTRQLDKGAEWADVSAAHLTFILDKLLDNAVKFNKNEPVQAKIRVDWQEPGLLRFFVSDNGPGIPHEFHDRIWEGFVQVEDLVTGQVPGLGVGLFMVREVVEAYKGEARVEASHIGEGTTILFTLPSTRL